MGFLVLDVQENHWGVLVYIDQLNQTLSREGMWGTSPAEEKGKGIGFRRACCTG